MATKGKPVMIGSGIGGIAFVMALATIFASLAMILAFVIALS